ncbi:MAG: glycosyltransferase [Erysipelotrichaceae bacterium]|nr:glycosyltransferase [Erysipelotrichaceae bacterium]
MAKALFITTKNLDYLRNVQEIEILKQKYGQVDVIGSSAKKYSQRLKTVYLELMSIDASVYEEVFVGFAPQLILPFFRKFKGTRLTIDFFISVYDTLVHDRKKFRDKGLASRIFHHIDQATLRAADRVICDTNAHGDFFSAEFNIPRAKIETLYLSADTSIFYPDESVEMDPVFTVLYFGSILPLQGVEIILEALKNFENDDTIRFVIIGPMKKNAPKPIQENIIYHDWLDQVSLAREINKSHLALAGHFNGTVQKARRTIPGKAYIYEACHKPMILGDNPATRELYHEGDLGIYFCEMSNPQALADLISSIRDRHYENKGNAHA